MRHRLESMCVLRWQLMQMRMMSCERYMQNFRMQRKRDIKQGIFLTIQENCVARPAMGQVLSALMCSFYRMWKYLARIVMEADITGMLGILKG